MNEAVCSSLRFEGRFEASLPVCPLTLRIKAHTADYTSHGCLGSKHDSANRRQHRSFVTFQMSTPPAPYCELCHIQRNLATQFPRRGLYLCNIGTRLRR